MATIPTVVEWLLRAAIGPDRATTEIGDLYEEVKRRHEAGLTTGRLWLWRQSAGLVLGAAVTAMPRTLRMWSHTLRDALRGFRSSPRTAAFAILILTLGMSSAVVTFSVVDHVVFRPLPYADDHRLVVVFGTTPRGRSLILSPQDYFAFRRGVPAFESVAGWSRSGAVRIDGVDQSVAGLRTSASLFDVLRIRPIIGRQFGPEHEQAGAPKVAVMSHGLWQRQFGGDPRAVGRSVLISGAAHEILGVLPPGADFPPGDPQPAEIWWPYVPRPEHLAYLRGRGRSWFLQSIAAAR